VLVGAGIGLCLTPLTSTVLSGIAPPRSGAASGVLSTTQHVGYALGVALTGVIFFGAGPAPPHAFELALVQLSVLAVGVVLTTRMLPRRALA
jgi:MFS family permease